jgi:glycosyltransferase involved in cell wall biosynthesis
MGQGALMEPSLDRARVSTGADPRFVSVVVPVVEQADDLPTLYRTYAAELDARGEEHEFVFVFDGGFTPPAELSALSQERDDVRLLRFARPFGETAALRLGIERSRGDVILTLPAYFQVKPEGLGTLLDALNDETDLIVANRSPRIDSWLNRLQSVAFNRMIAGGTDRPFHDIACGVRLIRRAAAEGLPLYGDLHRFIPALALREGLSGAGSRRAPAPQQRTHPVVRARGLPPPAARHRHFFLPRQVHREAAAIFRAGGIGILLRRRRDLAGVAGQPVGRPGHRQPAAPAARGPAAGPGRAAHGPGPDR